MTVSINSSVLIHRATAEVFAYISDYEKDPMWRSGVSEMRHDPPGETHLGMKTHERLTFAGMKTINVAEIVEFESGRKTAFRTIDGPLSASGYRVVEPDADGSRFTYAAEAELGGLVGRLSPFLQWLFRRTVRSDLERLKQILEAAPQAE